MNVIHINQRAEKNQAEMSELQNAKNQLDKEIAIYNQSMEVFKEEKTAFLTAKKAQEEKLEKLAEALEIRRDQQESQARIA